MNVYRRTVLALVVAVLLSGCSGINSLTESPSSSPPSPTDTENTNGTSSPTDTTITNEISTPTTIVKTAPGSSSEWSPPQAPNKPTEDKSEDERIADVQFVDRVAATTGSGVSNFNLAITANTTMRNIDPPDHGDVIGEPYFLIKIDDTLVERSTYFDPRQDEEYETFNITVRKEGLEQLDPGSLEVKVLLVDRDSEYDDVYDVWTGTIEYNPN